MREIKFDELLLGEIDESVVFVLYITLIEIYQVDFIIKKMIC